MTRRKYQAAVISCRPAGGGSAEIHAELLSAAAESDAIDAGQYYNLTFIKRCNQFDSQSAVNSQFIVGVGVYPNRTDYATFPPMLTSM